MDRTTLLGICLLVIVITAGIAASGATNIQTTVTKPTGDTIEKMQKVQDEATARKNQPGGYPSPSTGGKYHTRLVLLGTTGGVTWYPGTDRASSSSALVVGDTLYIIDLGQGSTSRLSEAFNPGHPLVGQEMGSTSTFLEKARALFFSHLHQDHIADYPSLLLIGPGVGPRHPD